MSLLHVTRRLLPIIPVAAICAVSYNSHFINSSLMQPVNKNQSQAQNASSSDSSKNDSNQILQRCDDEWYFEMSIYTQTNHTLL